MSQAGAGGSAGQNRVTTANAVHICACQSECGDHRLHERHCLAANLLTGKGKFVVLRDPPSLDSSLSVRVRFDQLRRRANSCAEPMRE
jgi:hypothetical protein